MYTLYILKLNVLDSSTVEPPVSGHPWDQKKCLLIRRGVRLWEVKNVVFVCGLDNA